ncbi:MAG: P1 family peptidase, partial [Ilumatobacteraceae bacterium]
MVANIEPGTRGCITDVPGVRVGHVHLTGRGWRTGTTVVEVPAGAVGGVDVRGGGPGTHETDLLRPENMVQHVHAVCLTGGSAFGLTAVTGVMLELEARGIGFPVGATAGQVVPIVPAAVIYDLGRGGTFTNRPDESFGRRAVIASRSSACREGSVGAGTGALAGGLQGGVGTASITLPSGVVVGAIAVLNSAGSVVDPATGLPWEADGHRLRRPSPSDRAALERCAGQLRTPLNTTIGVVATSASLSKAECSKFASVAHDGLARAVRPAHSLFDGDTIFALATGT